MMAAAAWQCVAACDALTEKEFLPRMSAWSVQSAGRSAHDSCARILICPPPRRRATSGHELAGHFHHRREWRLGPGDCARFLQESPANVVWLGVHANREHANQLAQENAGRCFCVALDVTSPESWQSAVKEILTRHRRLDVLVNNAGSHEDALLATMPADSWRRVLATNLDGVFHGCQTVLPAMISQRGGRIVNVSSLSALLAPAGQSNYAAAKAGVVALDAVLAKEVARIGITVNAVCPGYVETEALAHLAGDERKAAQLRIPDAPLRRPEEVAAAIRFLAGAEAGYITGSVSKSTAGFCNILSPAGMEEGGRRPDEMLNLE